MRALIINMEDVSKEDGFEEGEYDLLVHLQENKIPVVVTGVECPVDRIFRHDYHGINLPDGRHISALSGHHLVQIKG